MEHLNRDKLVNWFIKNEPQKYEDMLNSNHAVDIHQPNIFHSEGSVWTHTMMVMTWVEAEVKGYDLTSEEYNNYIVLLTTALLHDTGKPVCEERMKANETKPLRNSFKGHEGVSTFFAVGVLQKLMKDFPHLYDDKKMHDIIHLISTHGIHIDEKGYLKDLKLRFREADKMGAVRMVQEGLFEQYEPRKYLKKQPIQTDKKLIMLVGLPNSGKSTFREKVLKKCPSAFVISRDDTMETFYKSENNISNNTSDYNTMYKYVHENEDTLKRFEEAFQSNIKLAQSYDDVIVDMTLLSLSSRRKMLAQFPKHQATCFVIMTDNDTLEKRNIERSMNGKNIPNTVVNNMMKSFVFPLVEEGFENVFWGLT